MTPGHLSTSMAIMTCGVPLLMHRSLASAGGGGSVHRSLANDCSRQRRMYEVWHAHSVERARLCVSALDAIERSSPREIPELAAIAIYHRRSDRDPRTSPQAVARATFRDRPGRRLRRAGGRRPTTPPRRPRPRPPLPPPRAAHRPGGRAPVLRPHPRHRRSSPIRPTSSPRSSASKIPFWAMATLSLMPVWGFIYVRALTDGPDRRRRPARRGRRGVLQLRQLPRRRRRRRRRLPVHRRRGAGDVPATSPTRSATCTTAPRATTPRASTCTAIANREGGAARHRRARRDAGVR